MSLNVNEIATVTINAIKGGHPGSYEKIISATLSDPEAGTPVISEDGMSLTIQNSAVAKENVTVTIEIDNIAGEGGSLLFVSAPYSTVDNLLADGGSAVVS